MRCLGEVFGCMLAVLFAYLLRVDFEDFYFNKDFVGEYRSHKILKYFFLSRYVCFFNRLFAIKSSMSRYFGFFL